MLLLVVDTSGKHGSVALVREGENRDDIQVIAEVRLDGGAFSAQLVPQIAALLEQNKFRKSDIGAFIVVSGPGSFTGLRVGLAAVKALAEILQKPIVPVSLLEVVAFCSSRTGSVLAALDAGRGEAYVGEYEIAGTSARLICEQLLPKADFVSAARSGTVVTPHQSLAETLKENQRPVLEVAQPNAGKIGLVGWWKLQDDLTVSPEQLEANYIRRTDAELLPKSGS